MDPISALGIAASAVQFIDFGSKLVSRSKEIYQSSGGFSAEHVNLIETTNKMISLSQNLESTVQNSASQTLESHESQLLEVCRQCLEISSELITAINKIRTQGGHRKLNSFEQAFKSIWSQGQLDKLKKRLDESRQQLIVHILVSLRIDAIAAPPAAKDADSDPVTTVGSAFLKQIEDRDRWQADLINAIHQTYDQDQALNDLAQRSARAAEITQEKRSEWFTSQLLNRLRFPNIRDRQDRIPEAFQQTFGWIFQDDERQNREWSSFPDWLERGVGTYWITGKPGAGKSTLLKFLYTDARTVPPLKRWSSDANLVRASFFFWNSGVPLQMSQEGLLRTLLQESLEQCPQLAPRIFPAQWEAFNLFSTTVGDRFPLLDLRNALEQLVEEGRSQNMKFCFFIDGLDEFDGDHSELVTFFHRLLARGPHIKACVSSRPWAVFEDMFKGCPGLSLQDLTHADIEHFVSAKLNAHPGFLEIQQRESKYAPRLISEIAGKASGVFLWVDLVLRSLLEGLTHGDSISVLQRRVDEMPENLESLFTNILEHVQKLNPIYFQSASQLFQIVAVALRPPTLICLYFVDEENEDHDYYVNVEVDRLSNDERQSRAATMKRRLNSRTKGLLEVDQYSHRRKYEYTRSHDGVEQTQSLADLQVQYLHRTVKDYLANKKTWKWITAATGPSFVPTLSLCKSFIVQLKVTDTSTLELAGLWDTLTTCLKYAWLSENAIGKEYGRILDVIDKAAEKITTEQRYPQSPLVERLSLTKYHWSSAISGGRYNSTFLSFAVIYRLDSYVQQKIKDVNKLDLSALLHVAVVDHNNLPQLGDWGLPNQGCRNLKLIKALLKLGASPFEEFHGMSAYEVIQDEIHHHSADHAADRQRILIMFRSYKRWHSSKILSLEGPKRKPVQLTPELEAELIPTFRNRGSNISLFHFR